MVTGGHAAQIIARLLRQRTGEAPLLLQMTAALPLLRPIAARIIGLGIRPEHVTPNGTPAREMCNVNGIRLVNCAVYPTMLNNDFSKGLESCLTAYD